MTLQEFKIQSIPKIKNISQTPMLDIDVLLQTSFSYSKTQLLLHYKDEIPQEKINWLKNAIELRQKGIPIAYIIGQKEFYGFSFKVTKDVLIPKPDTEILVERAINIILEKIESRKNSILSICDMCTGSGCIGISIIKTLIENFKIKLEQLPKFTLVDISQKALEIAKENTKNLIFDLERSDFEKQLLQSKIKFIQSNLFQEVPYQFDVILSNPPYIPHTMVDELLKDGRNEPRLALDGDINLDGNRAINTDGKEKNDGLSIIQNLIIQSKTNLCPFGDILIETGEYNAIETAEFAKNYNYKTSIHKDLENQFRVVELNYKK